MKFIKNHFSLVLVILIVILLGVGLLFAKDFFLSNDTEAIYGSRLKDIKKYPVEEENKNKIIEGYNNSFSDETKIRISGRIIYIEIAAKEGVSAQDIRNSGRTIVDALTPEQLSYYDIQVLASSKTNENDFPVLGYKHHSKDGFSWVNKKTES